MIKRSLLGIKQKHWWDFGGFRLFIFYAWEFLVKKLTNLGLVYIHHWTVKIYIWLILTNFELSFTLLVHCCNDVNGRSMISEMGVPIKQGAPAYYFGRKTAWNWKKTWTGPRSTNGCCYISFSLDNIGSGYYFLFPQTRRFVSVRLLAHSRSDRTLHHVCEYYRFKRGVHWCMKTCNSVGTGAYRCAGG